jgi:uncharacterized membrane protein YfhO
VIRVDRPSPCLQENLKGGQVQLVDYRPNQVRLKVDSEGPGVLFLSDRYSPGWRVTVNGTSRDVFRANTEFRAVCVPEGESDVVFSYRPLSLYLGGGASILALLGTVITFLAPYIRKIHAGR